jgi:sulfide:quinone oxidoreductase
MTDITDPHPLRVVVAGGGVAALEAVLALHELAGRRVAVTLLTSSAEVVIRPMAVREPFDDRGPDRFAIAPILDELGAAQVVDDLASVDPASRTVTTTSGEVVAYDALIVAVGARQVVRYEHAVTIDDRKLDELLDGLHRDIERDAIRSLAFVAPPRMGWPLPLYELAMLTSHRARDLGIELAVTVVVPDDRPLAMFGSTASAGIAALLRDRRIDLRTSAQAEVPHRHQVVLNPGERRLQVDRVIALPELFGPAIEGLPHDQHGFLPVDECNRVPGTTGAVFAVGDASDYPIKHGGLAAQMADVAARAIAERAGAPVVMRPFDPVLRGMLLTGQEPRYLYAHRIGTHSFDSEFSKTPTWDPPSKISSHYLAPFLEQRRPVSAVGPAGSVSAR